MRRDLIVALVLVAAAMGTRTPHPPPAPAAGADLGEALAMLGGADAKHGGEQHAPMDAGYRHWDAADPSARSKPPSSASASASEDRRPPVVAGLVAVAGALGLSELAGLSLYLLADLAEDQEDWEATDLLLRAIPYVDPRMVDAYVIMSFIRRVDDPASAEEVLLRGVTYNPDVWELWYDLAWLQIGPHHKGEPDLEKARRYLEGGIAAPHPHFLTRTLGVVMQALGQKAEAEKLYRTLLARRDLPGEDRVATERALDDLQHDVDKLGIFRKRVNYRKAK